MTSVLSCALFLSSSSSKSKWIRFGFGNARSSSDSFGAGHISFWTSAGKRTRRRCIFQITGLKRVTVGSLGRCRNIWAAPHQQLGIPLLSFSLRPIWLSLETRPSAWPLCLQLRVLVGHCGNGEGGWHRFGVLLSMGVSNIHTGLFVPPACCYNSRQSVAGFIKHPFSRFALPGGAHMPAGGFWIRYSGAVHTKEHSRQHIFCLLCLYD